MTARRPKYGSYVFALALVALTSSIGCRKPLKPLALICSASPASIYPGEPVTVIGKAEGLNPQQCAVYSWSGAGATANGWTATVNTSSLAAGAYTVQGGVKECKPGAAVLPNARSADCTASFTVKGYEPPTISCSANPSTIKPGETSTVTSVGISPQNRPLTYSYSTTGGSVNGNGATAVYASTGAPTGAVGITCNLTDDKNQTATANTSVTITAPYVAPVPHTQALCSISFEQDKKNPTRVNNEAKACLDELALDLQRQSDAKAFVVGEATTAEKTPKKGKHAKAVENIAGQRAVNVKEYLVMEKGIDASRLSVVTGTKDGQTVEHYLVPSGANFSSDVTGTSAVDEAAVKPQVRKPLGQKRVHRKKPIAPK